MLYIGLMSGTSMDAVDAALVRFEGDALSVIAYEQYPITADIQTAVRQLNPRSTLETVTRHDQVLGQLFADAVDRIIASENIAHDDITAIGSHGQTILHLPDAEYPRTFQIGNPDIIAERSGITTVAGFRGRDMAAGGQGAPLAPVFHDAFFRKPGTDRVILNIGGMANVTLLPADENTAVTGFDTGPGNALMDDWAQAKLGKDYDENGLWAASATVDEQLLDTMLADPYFTRPPPKSTGRDYFNPAWLDRQLATLNHRPGDDVIQATLLELSVHTIKSAVTAHAPGTQEVLVCGGGIHNGTLLNRLEEALPGMAVQSTASHGIDPDAVEAVCFAWLAKCRLDDRPATSSAVSGARGPRILGAVYSGEHSSKED